MRPVALSQRRAAEFEDIELEPQHRRLLLLTWMVEHVNAISARMCGSASGQPIFLSSVIERARSQLCRSKPAWSRTSLLDALASVGLEPEPDPSEIEHQLSWLMGAIRDRPEGGQRRLPEVRRWTLPRRELSGALHIAEHDHELRSQQRVDLIDEALDPVMVLVDYLRTGLKVSGTLVEHELQRFIRRSFGLKHSQHYVLLANLCARLNVVYYRRPAYSVHVSQDPRTPVVETAALLQIIRDDLYASLQHLEPERRRAIMPEPERSAIGFLLSLRFCQLIRVQLQVPEPALAGSAGAGEAELSVRSELSLLQPLENSRLRSRIFGSLSGIEGLNEIFGGGILPGVNLGRVWVVAGPAGSGKTSLALHLSADMAARRHLVIYFSFEESYRNISDRAVMFRLYQHDRFQVRAVDDDLESVIASAYDDEADRGLLLFYREPRYDLSQALETIRTVVERRAPAWSRSLAVVIDSVDGLDQGAASPEDGDSRSGRRKLLRVLFRQLEEANYWAVLLTERSNPELPTLEHLADTYIEVGPDESTGARWLQIHKCRPQEFQTGKHGYYLRDSQGAALVPNLRATQRATRRRVPATLSESRVIPLPDALWGALPTPYVREKSSTLIWGNRLSGKTAFWLNLLTEPSRRVPVAERNQLEDREHCRAALPSWLTDDAPACLVICFRTPAQRFRQALRSRRALQSRWNRRRQRLRWYRPGPELTAAQVLRDLHRAIEQARIEGSPIERIVFEEIDALDALLPTLAQEPAFWPTVFGLLASEALTASYVFGSEMEREPPFIEQFVSSMDYAFRLFRPAHQQPAPGDDAGAVAFETTELSMYKLPGPSSAWAGHSIRIVITPEGEIELEQR